MNFIFNTVHKFIGSIEKLCDISSIVLDEGESTTRVKMFKIVNFEDLVVKHYKFLLFIEYSFFKSFNRHFWLLWQENLFIGRLLSPNSKHNFDKNSPESEKKDIRESEHFLIAIMILVGKQTN